MTQELLYGPPIARQPIHRATAGYDATFTGPVRQRSRCRESPARPSFCPPISSGRDFAVGEGAVTAGRTVAEHRISRWVDRIAAGLTNPAAPRNAVSPWEAGAPRSAASRWEAAPNPWLCDRTGARVLEVRIHPAESQQTFSSWTAQRPAALPDRARRNLRGLRQLS